MDTMWDEALEALHDEGIEARVVDASRLDEVLRRVEETVAEGEFPDDVGEELAAETSFSLPDLPAEKRSVVIAATGRPLTQATVTWRGQPHTVAVPPHYAGYYTVPEAIARRVAELLAPHGFSAVKIEPPLKTLAVYGGLARYGRNNITYVPGLGSYLQLAAAVTDAPPPADDGWIGAPQVLKRCERCSACLRACPTQAIGGDRFLLHTERCLTYHNENRQPLPAWLDPAVHHAAVGCLRCQLVCPENASVELVTADPEWFSEAETHAILEARDWSEVSAATRTKLERCGLDYSPQLISRNLRLLLV